MTKQNHTPKTPENKPKKAPSKRSLMRQLVEFYWQILDDPELKPSDRIASAKRLESLVMGDAEKDQAPKVTVILNIPEGA